MGDGSFGADTPARVYSDDQGSTGAALTNHPLAAASLDDVLRWVIPPNHLLPVR